MILRSVAMALVLGTSLLRAQQASVFLGGSRARYADSVPQDAAFAGARLAAGRGLSAAVLDGTVAWFADGGWAFQAAGNGAVLWGAGPWALGLAIGGAYNDYQAGPVSGTAAGGPLIALTRGRSLLTVGASGGAVRSVDGRWTALGSASTRWEYMPTRAVSVDAGIAATAADTTRFADAGVGLQFRLETVRAGARIAARTGDLADGAFGSLELSWQPFPVMAVEAAAGRYPRDLAGFAEGAYAQLGMRFFAARRGHRADPGSDVGVARQKDGRVRLSIRYGTPTDTLVIVGSWNGWTPAPLTRAGRGRWTIDLPLAPGSYRYALRAGDAWVLPDGVAGVPDEFGGREGVLVVPPR